MEQAIVKSFIDYGLPGLVIVSLFWIIHLIIKQSREERSEWLQTYKTLSKMADERQKETNSVLHNLTAVIERSISR